MEPGTSPLHHIASCWHEHSLHHGPVDFFALRNGPLLAITAERAAVYRSREGFHRPGLQADRGLLGSAILPRAPLRRRATRTGLAFVDRIVSHSAATADGQDHPVDILLHGDRELVRIGAGSVRVGPIRIWVRHLEADDCD